jgi:hypothetical protein
MTINTRRDPIARLVRFGEQTASARMNWIEVYRNWVVRRPAEMNLLLRHCTAAIRTSIHPRLRDTIAASRVVAPLMLCYLLDECGEPVPTQVSVAVGDAPPLGADPSPMPGESPRP